jgi:hypothetical protein
MRSGNGQSGGGGLGDITVAGYGLKKWVIILFTE